MVFYPFRPRVGNTVFAIFNQIETKPLAIPKSQTDTPTKSVQYRYMQWLFRWGILIWAFPLVVGAQETKTAPVVLSVFDDVAVCRDINTQYTRQDMNAYVLTELLAVHGTATTPALTPQERDIIPPFLYEIEAGLLAYPGHNWNEDTLASYDQDCRPIQAYNSGAKAVFTTQHIALATTTTQSFLSAVTSDTLVQVTIPPGALPHPIIGGEYTLTITALDSSAAEAVSESFLLELADFAQLMEETSSIARSTRSTSIQTASVIDADIQAKLREKSPLVILPAATLATSSIAIAQADNLLETHISVTVTDAAGNLVPTFAGAIAVAVFNPTVLQNKANSVYGFHKGAISETWMQRTWEARDQMLSVPIFGSGLVSLWSIPLIQPAAVVAEVVTSGESFSDRLRTCLPIVSFTLLLGVFTFLYRTQLVSESLARNEFGHAVIEVRSTSYMVKHFVLLFLVATEVLLIGYVLFCLLA